MSSGVIGLNIRAREITRASGGGGFLLVPFADRATTGNLRHLLRWWTSIEHEHELRLDIGKQPRRSVEQTRQVRRNAALRVCERRPVRQSNQRQKLIELAMGVHCEPFTAQIGELDRVLDDDWREENAHRKSGQAGRIDAGGSAIDVENGRDRVGVA